MKPGRALSWLTLCVAAAILFVVALGGLRWGRVSRLATAPAAPLRGEPLTMLWAWETPQDLTALDPARAGVAFLSREILIGKTIELRPRRQPLHVAPQTWLMAVVRIETSRLHPAVDTPELRTQVAAYIAEAATAPGVRAVQVDFDATVSERALYAGILRELRPRLAPDMPLSVTALASWCRTGLLAPRSFLADLPIDEAVPMYFRMGGPAATRAAAPRSAASPTEPLCAGSAGIATDEAWPAIHSGQRVYVFRNGPWTPDEIARVNVQGYAGLRQDHAP